MRRRTYLRSAGVGVAGLLAGCTAEPANTETGGTAEPTEATTGTTTGTPTSTEVPTLTVGTYASFVDAPSTSPGAWVKERFEAEHDATLAWSVPENGMDRYIQQRNQGVDVEADLFAGLTPENIVRADQNLNEGSLFEAVDTDAIDNYDHIVDGYDFDPQGRALPMGGSHISLVYNQNLLDERGVDAPQTFEDLTKDAYSDGLLIPNPQNSETGLEFLFWTVEEFGADGYLDYWQRLLDNGARVIGSWSDAYAAYENNEAPMVVSYSTDPVFADSSGADMAKHRIGFLNGEGYAYVEAMARFSGTDHPELAEAFLSFMLRPEIQTEIAQRNIALPAVDNAELPEKFDSLTPEPETVVSFTYDELSANMSDWLTSWSRQVATQ